MSGISNDIQNALIDSLGIGVFSYTMPDRQILIFNTEAKRLFDCKESDSHCDFLNVIHKKIAPADYRSMSVITATLKNPGDSVKYTFHITKDNGETLTVRCNSKLLVLPDGQQYIISTMRDVTEHERLDEGLDEERRQYREALSLNSYLSFNIDITDGYFYQTIMTKDGREFVGKHKGGLPVSYDEMLENTIGRMHPVFLTKGADAIMTCEKLTEWFLNENSHFSGEYYLRDTGKYYHVLALLSYSKSIDGHINANILVYDTTDKKLEEETRRSIIDSFGSVYFASWILDLTGGKMDEINVPEFGRKITEAGNGNIKECFAFYIDQVMVKEYIEIMTDFLNVDTLKERLSSHEVLSCEYLSKLTGWNRAYFIPVEGSFERVIFAVQGIDKEKKKENEIKMALQHALEAAKGASHAKTHFFEKMSHDIRTPLNGIIGMTAIAQSHITDQLRVEDCLNKIAVSGNHLLRLVNEVLDMSKIESGRMELQNEEFNLRDILNGLTDIVKQQTEEKAHSFRLCVGELEHDLVVGDQQKLLQILLNLIGNSVKYTEKGGSISLEVSEIPIRADKAGCYEFVIEDNGIGMSEDFLEKLFEPFSRAEDMRVQNTQGTGLGMSIVKSIVQMMNGTIKVQSRLNEGTKFIVTLFFRLPDDAERQASESQAILKEGSTIQQNIRFPGKRALLVEDNELNAEIAGEFLGMTELKIEYAANGEEAFQKVKEAEDGYYDIIFMDILMPVMNGYKATKAIRSLPRDYTKHVPIIAMTANAFMEDIKACKEAGMNEHVAKPVDFAQLGKVLNRYLTPKDSEEHMNGGDL